MKEKGGGVAYANALVDVWVGGVPVLEEAPESKPSPPRDSEPPGPSLRPLLLRELNIDVGPREMGPLAVLEDVALRRRRSSIATLLEAGGWKPP